MANELVHVQLDPDPVRACEELLASAKSGQVAGLAVVVLFRRGRYMVDVSGDARNRPTLMRGAVMALDDCLREMVHRGDVRHTNV